MKGLIGILLVSISFQASGQFSPRDLFNRELTPAQLQEDFSLFRKSLEKIHPGLYRYTPRPAMDSIFDAAFKNLGEPTAYKDFYKLLALVNAQVRCQHTAVAPSEIGGISKNARMFPFEILWDFDPVKAFIFSDVSNEGGIRPATEILSINGQPVRAVYDTLMRYLFADGYNITSKQSRLIPFDFQHWYYLLIDRPDTFTLELSINGAVVKKNAAAITLDEYKKNGKKYHKSNDPEVKRLMKYYVPKHRLDRFRLEFPDKTTALLTLKEFGSLEFFERSFGKMKERRIKNLIIDVRRNGGGWDDFGFKLFSYLIKKPTRYYDSLYTSITDIEFLMKYTDKDSAWLKEVEPLWWKDGKPLPGSVSEGLKLQQPQANRFEGDVYVLMDGGSMSTTAEFTAATHYNKLATFIGEESGGAYEGGNGADFATVTLPHSHLFINIPLAKYVMATTPKVKGRGTIPDHQVSKTVKDWYELRDPALELALELIKRKTK